MPRIAILGVWPLMAVTLLGQSSEVFVRQAKEDIAAGRYAQAEKDLSSAVQAEPGSWKLWSNLGVVRVQLGENDSAIKAFERARQLAPQEAPPYFGLGLAYLKNEDIERALKAYRDGLARDPNDVAANQNYAFLLTQKADFRDAIEPLKKLETLQPGSVPARTTLIEAYFKAGMKDAAETEVNQLLSAHITTMQEELSLAKMLLADREPGAATEVLGHAAETWPDAPEPHGELGLLLMENGQYETAARELGRAAQLDPNSAEYALGLGENLLRWRHDPIALNYLLAIQAKFGELPLYKFELGMAYYDMNEAPLALKEFANLAQEQPKSSQAQYYLGAAYQELGQLDKAEECYRQAIALNPDNASYYFTLASLLKKVNPADLSEPARLGEKALALSPEDENVKLLLASCYQMQGKLGEAQTLLESVIGKDPDYREAHVTLAQVYLREKRMQDAEQQESIAAKLFNRKQSAISPWGPGGIGGP